MQNHLQEDSEPRLFFEGNKIHDVMHGLGNPPDKVQEMIGFEMFHPTLENKNWKNNAGRKSFDAVLMSRILFRYRYYSLANHNTQYQILDRLGFRDFLGVQTAGDAPDEKTAWKYREALAESGISCRLIAIKVKDDLDVTKKAGSSATWLNCGRTTKIIE